MTCRPPAGCGHEFCWRCLAPYDEILRYGNHKHQVTCQYYAIYDPDMDDLLDDDDEFDDEDEPEDEPEDDFEDEPEDEPEGEPENEPEEGPEDERMLEV